MPSKQDFTMTHYSQNIQNPKRQNFGSSKRKDFSNTREPHKGISRNLVGEERDDTFKMLKKKNCKTKIRSMAELPTKEEEEIKTLLNK